MFGRPPPPLPPSPTQNSTIRWALGSLLAFGALNAFAGGIYGLAGAQGVPTAWLEGSPFRDYTIPSLILFVVVGGAMLVGAVAVLRQARGAQLVAYGAGVVVLGWIAAQVAILGYVSWMQPLTAAAAGWVLLLAHLLPTPERSGSRGR